MLVRIYIVIVALCIVVLGTPVQAYIIRHHPLHESSIQAIYLHQETKELYTVDAGGLVLIHALKENQLKEPQEKQGNTHDIHLALQSYYYLHAYDSISRVRFDYPYVLYTTHATRTHTDQISSLQLFRLDIQYNTSITTSSTDIVQFDIASKNGRIVYLTREGLVHMTIGTNSESIFATKMPINNKDSRIALSESGDSYFQYKAESGVLSYFEWQNNSLLGEVILSPNLHDMHLSPKGRYVFALNDQRTLLTYDIVRGELFDSVALSSSEAPITKNDSTETTTRINSPPSIPQYSLSNVNSQNRIATIYNTSVGRAHISLYQRLNDRLVELPEFRMSVESHITASLLTDNHLWLGTEKGQLLRYAMPTRMIHYEFDDTTIAFTDIALREESLYALSNDGLRSIPTAIFTSTKLEHSIRDTHTKDIQHISYVSQKARFVDHIRSSDPVNSFPTIQSLATTASDKNEDPQKFSDSSLYLYFQNKNGDTFVNTYIPTTSTISPLALLPHYPYSVQLYNQRLYSFAHIDSTISIPDPQDKKLFSLQEKNLYAEIWPAHPEPHLLSNRPLSTLTETFQYELPKLVLSNASDLQTLAFIDIPFSSSHVREYFFLDKKFTRKSTKETVDLVIGAEIDDAFILYRLRAQQAIQDKALSQSTKTSQEKNSEEENREKENLSFTTQAFEQLLEIPLDSYVFSRQYNNTLYIVTHKKLYLVQINNDENDMLISSYALHNKVGKIISLTVNDTHLLLLDAHGIIHSYAVYYDNQEYARLSLIQRSTVHVR